VEAEGVPEELVEHKVIVGNRPTTTILAERLTPFDAGQPHRALRAQGVRAGVIWGINSFDQWGVELGKVLAAYRP
jgi:glucose-6-phosphate isomerase